MKIHAPVRRAALFALSGILVAAPAQAATFTLSPTDDTFVQQTQPSVNYGSLAALAIGFAFPGTDAWLTYLRFDLGSIPSSEQITGATLHLFQYQGGGFVPIGSNLFRITNDTWSESTVTWSNQPSGFGAAGPLLGTLLAFNSDGGDHRGWSTWDLFQNAAWDPTIDRADGALTLQLFETMGGTQSHNYCSKESDLSNCLAPNETGPVSELRRPFLTITTTTVPEPSTALLLSAAIGGLALGGRRRNGAGRGCAAEGMR